MVLVALTPEELVRHEQALGKLRLQLFREHTSDDYGILPNSERVIRGYAEMCWNASCGSYRVLHLGGLEYRMDCADPAGFSRFTVSHVGKDRFDFWLSAPQGHTVSVKTLRFRELDEIPFRYVSSCRRSNVSPAHVVKSPAP